MACVIGPAAMKIKSLSVLGGAGCALLLASGLCHRACSQQAAPLARSRSHRRGDAAALSPEPSRRQPDPFFDTDKAAAIGETRALLDPRRQAHRRALCAGCGLKTRLLESIRRPLIECTSSARRHHGRRRPPRARRSSANRGMAPARKSACAITLRELKQMRSGLSHVELGEPREKADSLAMLVSPRHGDQAAYAAAKPLCPQAGNRASTTAKAPPRP